MQFSRRRFMGYSAVAAFLGSVVSSVTNAEEKRRARGGDKKAEAAAGPLAFPLIETSDSTAKAVNYVKQHADLKDAKLKLERQGTAWDQQFCNNCSFYKEVGSKDGTKVGTCTIFANKLVVEKAWCTSWNKKA
jgi:hypothetical protein